MNTSIINKHIKVHNHSLIFTSKLSSKLEGIDLRGYGLQDLVLIPDTTNLTEVNCVVVIWAIIIKYIVIAFGCFILI